MKARLGRGAGRLGQTALADGLGAEISGQLDAVTTGRAGATRAGADLGPRVAALVVTVVGRLRAIGTRSGPEEREVLRGTATVGSDRGRPAIRVSPVKHGSRVEHGSLVNLASRETGKNRTGVRGEAAAHVTIGNQDATGSHGGIDSREATGREPVGRTDAVAKAARAEAERVKPERAVSVAVLALVLTPGRDSLAAGAGRPGVSRRKAVTAGQAVAQAAVVRAAVVRVAAAYAETLTRGAISTTDGRVGRTRRPGHVRAGLRTAAPEMAAHKTPGHEKAGRPGSQTWESRPRDSKPRDGWTPGSQTREGRPRDTKPRDGSSPRDSSRTRGSWSGGTRTSDSRSASDSRTRDGRGREGGLGRAGSRGSESRTRDGRTGRTESADRRTTDRVSYPPVPASITADQLDPEARAELRTLPGDLADAVARLLVAAVLAEDPERGYQYAVAARELAARVGVVRETCGLAAYQAGKWAEALAELRAARRLTGQEGYLPMMADCERALGRLDRALDLISGAQDQKLGRETQVELRIVESGIRRDQGFPEAAVVALQIPELNDARPTQASARLWYAYADALDEAGRADEARHWFAKAAAADPDGLTDAADRADDFDLLAFDDLEAEPESEADEPDET